MPNHVEQLILKYRARGLIIDTNLLLLYVVGQFDPQQITTFKRLREYRQDDFDLLAGIVQHFKTIVVTPSILTEVSNLAAHLPADLKKPCFDVFGQLIATFREKYRPSRTVCQRDTFRSFGLADAGLAELAPGAHLVLTDDLPLYHFMAGTGSDVVNFNHLRTLSW